MSGVIGRSTLLTTAIPDAGFSRQIGGNEAASQSHHKSQLHAFCLHRRACQNVGQLRASSTWRLKLSRSFGIVCSSQSWRGDSGGATPVFPRIDVRDPYKRLGISQEASEEEIREARNFLLNQYGAHKQSAKAIESAYDKIIFESLRQRKKHKATTRKLSPPPAWLTALSNRIEAPPLKAVLLRAAVFAALGVWSIVDSADGGPAFQVLLSFVACVYFLNQRLKSTWKSVIVGFGALILGWVLGSFLIPVLPTLVFPGSWNIELMTSLISYVFLFFPATYLR
ncbi:hypothetical protein O6H91_13G036600 [Diphasiastrum complanatum]|uniref:Uncharacterized protein n=4 Tax=Diphasiastrum complanatum TaxID=34168 RepID=A0ACC2BS85_DIPCM|nr:hypothetical protein O6H91_13G013200 [Diphasiastrum complanatum]KAJ7533179.1 hypothetical protein O6H91_13G036600 [Diphasiastrum complanatum]